MTRWDPVAAEAAVRRGEPIVLAGTDLAGHAPEQVVPLCAEVTEPGWARWLAPARGAGSPRSNARVTAVIPTATRVPAGLDALLGQDVQVAVHVLWNGPGPAPSMPGAVVRRVPWLGHGPTRQAAVGAVDTELLLFLSDDALPLGAGFVRALVDALDRSAADAVWARQVPWPTASGRTRARLRVWCPADGVVPSGRLDHVCALHRTALLRADPLDPVDTAEDWAWGRRHRTLLVPEAPVLHSHVAGLRSSFARTVATHRVRIAAGEQPGVRHIGDVLRGIAASRGDRDALGELLGQWWAAT